MKVNKVAVVIPFYHSDLSDLEIISLNQCISVLDRYQIILLTADNIPQENLPQNKCLQYMSVSSDKLRSVKSYNEMLLTKEFYQLFNCYEFILIYQLDAFVFCDRLEYFCEMGYDYIGAPWIYGSRYYKDKMNAVVYVGNGGFSLRNINAFIKLLENVDTRNVSINEDVFFAGQASREFNVAPTDVALSFAFERDVKLCYELNGNELPFGCHAWEKHNLEFWKPYLEKEGFKLPECTTGNLDYIDPAPDKRYLEVSPEKLLKYWQKYNVPNRKIYIFGAGVLGEECGWLLKKAGIEKFSYYDNGEILDKKIWGKEVIRPHRNDKISSENLIVIAMKKNCEEIIKQLKLLGYAEKNIVTYNDVICDLQEMVN